MPQEETPLAELVIEGPDAALAARELMDPDVVRGRIDAYDGDYREPMTLAVVASVIGLVAAGAQLSDHVVRWYAKWRGPAARIEKAVLILPDGRRVVLEDTTPSELRQLLKD
ncbi:hypothetical protein [Streptomyces sp. NPDC057302]|uniref:hypothetical protein n=1 Tax=Streptomyces sp. NPDC057302 TaxID=3346094 RepID=UPI0036373DFC